MLKRQNANYLTASYNISRKSPALINICKPCTPEMYSHQRRAVIFSCKGLRGAELRFQTRKNKSSCTTSRSIHITASSPLKCRRCFSLIKSQWYQSQVSFSVLTCSQAPPHPVLPSFHVFMRALVHAFMNVCVFASVCACECSCLATTLASLQDVCPACMTVITAY